MISDCERAIELDKTNIKGYYLVGVAKCRLLLWEEGIKALEQALGATVVVKKSKQFRHEIHTELLRARKALWKIQQKEKKRKLDELETHLTLAIHQSETDAEAKSHLIQRMSGLFQQIEDQQLDEIPEYFCCAISMDIMTDPVVTPNGISYERHLIEEHIRQNGAVDPVTRDRLTIDMLRPNVGLRAAIDHFLEQHPWAFEVGQ